MATADISQADISQAAYTNTYMSPIGTYVPPSVIIQGDYKFKGTSQYIQPDTIALVVKLDSYPSKTVNRTLSNGSVTVINVHNLIQDSVELRTYDGTLLKKDTDYKMAVNAEEDSFSITVTKESIRTQTILISYKYLPDDFFEPLAWFALNSVTGFYGEAFNDDYSIGSPVTAAAKFAFANGATSMRIIPVYDDSKAGNNPTQTLAQALDKLKLCQDVAIIVPIGFDDTQFGQITEHIAWCNANRLERRAIYSIDGTVKKKTVSDLTTIARSVNNEFIMFIANNIAPVYVSNSRQAIDEPGWLWGAAMAGLAISTPVQNSLTRLELTGFYGTQAFLYEEKNQLTEGGCCVVETYNGIIRIRHSVTTYQNTMVDWTFSGIYNYMIFALRTMYDPYIGNPSTDALVAELNSITKLFLQQQVERGVIYDFNDLEVSRRENNPQIIDVSFRYAAIQPLLWIVVTFDVDMTY